MRGTHSRGLGAWGVHCLIMVQALSEGKLLSGCVFNACVFDKHY